MKTCNLFAIGIFLVLIPLCALADEKKSNSTMGTKTSGLYEVEYSLEPMSNTIPPLHEFKVIVRDLRSKEILTHANMRFEKNVLMSGGSLEIKNEKSIEAMKNLAEFSYDKNAAQDGITISVFYAYLSSKSKCNTFGIISRRCCHAKRSVPASGNRRA